MGFSLLCREPGEHLTFARLDMGPPMCSLCRQKELEDIQEHWKKLKKELAAQFGNETLEGKEMGAFEARLDELVKSAQPRPPVIPFIGGEGLRA